MKFNLVKIKFWDHLFKKFKKFFLNWVISNDIGVENCQNGVLSSEEGIKFSKKRFISTQMS